MCLSICIFIDGGCNHVSYHSWLKLYHDIMMLYEYCQISNIRCIKSQKFNASRLVLQLSLPNLLKPCVKSRMKIQLEQRRRGILQLHLIDQLFNCLLKCLLYQRFDYKHFNRIAWRQIRDVTIHYLQQWWSSSTLHVFIIIQRTVKTLRPGQNGRHFAYEIVKSICWIEIVIFLSKFYSKGIWKYHFVRVST